ncbi:MAG: HAD family phosphatase [Synergistes sp.]|nr:HAD family phosphatase [Synergistes sp.]
MIRGAIFDIDGVILDSMSIWNELGGRYLNSLGIEPEYNLSRILFPMTMHESASYLKCKYGIPKSEDEIKREIGALLKDFYFYEARAKEGAAKLLSRLGDMKIPAAAATSSPRTLVTAALERLDLLKYFRLLLTTDELNTTKHSPDIYLAAAKEIDREPHETAVFEDAYFAVVSAKSAGFVTVWICEESRAAEETAICDKADCHIMSLCGGIKLFEEGY